MKKVKGGAVSDEQKDWIDYLKSVGYECFVCKGKDEAVNCVTSVINNLK